MPRKTATIYICTKRSGSRNVLKGRAQAYGVRRTGTRKVNAENERKKRIPNQRKISAKSGAQKLNKNQNADIKCVKKISTRIAGGISLYKKRPLSQVNCSNLYRQHKLEQFKFGGGLFCCKNLQKRFKHCVFKVFVHTKWCYVGDCLGFWLFSDGFYDFAL